MINIIKKTKEILGLSKKKNFPMEIGVLDNKIILKFPQPIKYIQLNKLEAMDLLMALTQKIPAIKVDK